jgi:integration host factor subunit alpha|tara:strand:- start:2532 stop:2849 length:318 start_codon:yes stop_codon:yes gene_type:complete
MTLKVLTKAILVEHINETIGLSKRESQEFFESLLSLMKESLINKNDVKIVNFGIFKIRSKKGRIGRNPKTKEEVKISPRDVVTFKPSESLINSINSNLKNSNEKS